MSLIMAHRGARDLWAENSATGFRQTARLGFDAVEFDLHLSDAGELLVIHDALLDRTTDAKGPVRLAGPDQRRSLRLKGPDGTPIAEGIPTLETVLPIFADHPRTELFIELKADETGRPYRGLVARTASVLRAAGLESRAVLHAFDIETLHEIRALAPEFRRLISVDHVWAAKQGGIAAFLRDVDDLVDVVGIHHALFAEEYAAITALRAKERCSVWTINTPELMREWIERAPGYLVSDNPVMLREIMQEGRK